MSITFKIVLVGASGVGKTSFLTRHLTTQFVTKHAPTLGVDVQPLQFATNYGPLRFNTWDGAGNKAYALVDDPSDYWKNADAAIIMFDLFVPESLEAAENWRQLLVDACGDIPMVLCGNKFDLWNLEDLCRVPARQLSNYSVYYEISAKSCYNFVEPWLWLARKLTGHADLTFDEWLTELPELPTNLQKLDCSSCNQLTELPELPTNLQRLDCTSGTKV